MTAPTATPARPGPWSAGWRALGVDVQVLVTEADALEPARELLAHELAAIDLACSQFRPDSEVVALAAAGGRRVPVSPLLAEAVGTALEAAARTGGLLDPTLGSVLADLGYDRDFASLPVDAGAGQPRVRPVRRASWRDVDLDDDGVRVPAGVLLDLGATAKALSADRAAAGIAQRLGCGVLVNLGGDLAVAGPAPAGGWAVRVQDRPGRPDAPPDGPQQTVSLTSGGLATSSTTARRWRHGGDVLHHIVDPVTLAPAASPWRTVSVAAAGCVQANVASTTAIIRGRGAEEWLRELGLPARLVSRDGDVRTLDGWPSDKPSETDRVAAPFPAEHGVRAAVGDLS
ncbi:MAG: FAD:protein FMN transferase [Motilibacteraceae bacterium]